MLCKNCGVDVDGPGCNEEQAQECINNQPRGLHAGEVPEGDAYYPDDER